MNIGVFCSACDLDGRYVAPALEAVRAFARAGHDLVWGGSDTGLMKAIADVAQAEGRRIRGVSVEFLRAKARNGADEMHFAADLGTRKAKLLELSDAFLILPGGLGTLDEATEVLEHKKHGHHQKPVVFLNVDGFYDGLRVQLQRMEADGFTAMRVPQLARFVAQPSEVLGFLAPTAT